MMFFFFLSRLSALGSRLSALLDDDDDDDADDARCPPFCYYYYKPRASLGSLFFSFLFLAYFEWMHLHCFNPTASCCR